MASAELDEGREDHDVADRREQEHDADHHVEGVGGAAFADPDRREENDRREDARDHVDVDWCAEP